VSIDYSLIYAEVKEQINQRIWENRTVSTDKSETEMSISHGSTNARMTYGTTEKTLMKSVSL
jgi:hypothetical protein